MAGPGLVCKLYTVVCGVTIERERDNIHNSVDIPLDITSGLGFRPCPKHCMLHMLHVCTPGCMDHKTHVSLNRM